VEEIGMETKKGILRKMFFIGLIVSAASGLALLVAAYLFDDARQKAATKATEHQEAKIREYRAYLAETAKKINRLPVDPHILGAAQARFYDERTEAELYLWAMDTHGQFQFGVPEGVFTQLNAAYDKCRTAIEEEGRFADRQEFIRRQVQDHPAFDLSRYLTEAPTGLAQPGYWAWNWPPDERWVFSTPFESPEGEMLGNLYLKVLGLGRDPWRSRAVYEGPMAASAILFIASIVFLWFLLPTWVYLDARGRGVSSPAVWSAVTLVSLVFGLAAYLIVRPEERAAAACQKCGRTGTGGTYCAYCGSPVPSEFCQGCGYPTRTDWFFCPNCRASLRAKPDEPPAGQTEVLSP
jgi:hypothetical protein